MKIYSGIALFAAVVLAGCGSNPGQDKFQGLAEGLCSCMRPMMEFQQELMQRISDNMDEELMGMLERNRQIDEDGRVCIESLEAQYGVIQEEDETQLMEAMQKACPDIIKMMEESAMPGSEDFFEDGEVPFEEMFPEAAEED